MSKYLSTLEFKTTFEGDEVRVTMKPLTRASFLKVLDVTAAHRLGLTPDQNAAKVRAFYSLASEILEDHVVDVHGLRDAGGNSIGKEVVLRDTYFSELVTDAFNYLTEKGSVGKEMPLSSEEKLPEGTEAH